MAEWSKTLDFVSELEIAQVQILYSTPISTIDLVLYRLSSLFYFIRSSHRAVAHENCALYQHTACCFNHRKIAFKRGIDRRPRQFFLAQIRGYLEEFN
ncbi:hypothetical protein J6590_102957 [Homalodisca vitripennis]|nr:hypothetical protein J6590_102957 [Homalodisca vitripennis]